MNNPSHNRVGEPPKNVGRERALSAADALKELSAPWVGGEKTKQVIDRAARRAGLSYWRAFDIWYGKARRIEAFEQQQLAQAVAEKRAADDRRELHTIRLRLEALEARLRQTDEDFYRPEITALGHQLRTSD